MLWGVQSSNPLFDNYVKDIPCNLATKDYWILKELNVQKEIEVKTYPKIASPTEPTLKYDDCCGKKPFSYSRSTRFCCHENLKLVTWAWILRNMSRIRCDVKTVRNLVTQKNCVKHLKHVLNVLNLNDIICSNNQIHANCSSTSSMLAPSTSAQKTSITAPSTSAQIYL